jgi:hypothetical protein
MTDLAELVDAAARNRESAASTKMRHYPGRRNELIGDIFAHSMPGTVLSPQSV